MANDSNEQQVFDAIINYENSGYDAALQEAEALDEVRQQLAEGADISLRLAVENEDALTSLSDLDGETFSPSIEPTVDDSELLLLDELEGASYAPEINPDLDEAPLTELDDLAEEPIEPEINPEASEEGKSLLTTLHELGVNPIQIVMNVAGTILDVISKIEQFALAPILDAEDAAAKFAGQTGNSPTGIADDIRDTLYADLGDNAGQIADLYIQAEQLNAPFKEATESALTFVHTFSNADPQQVLLALNSLVSEGLVPTFGDATDLLVKFYQEGGNKGGDALQTIQQYASSWKDAGLNGEQSLGLINSGLDGGIDSATKAALALQTFDDNLTAAAANPTSDQAKFLDKLGLGNPKEEGEQAGADYIDAFISKVNELPADQQQEGFDLFGKGGKKFTGAISGLDSGSLGPYEDIVNAAEEAAGQVDDSLRGILDDFTLAINEKVSDILSSDVIDIPGKVAALKTGLQDALDTLTSGGTLEDALEVGLKPIGFDDEFQRLESIFGNLVIQMLQIVASIQDLTGHGDQASVTRDEIARLSTQQLQFDLQVNNPDDVAGAVKTALDRGVELSKVNDLATSAVGELVNSGDLDQAQALLDKLQNGEVTVRAFEFGKETESLTIPVTPEMSQEDIDAAVADAQNTLRSHSLLAQINTDTSNFGFTPEQIAEMQKQIDDAQVALVPTTPLGVGFGAAGGNVNRLTPDPTISDRAGGDFDQVSTKAADAKVQLDALAQSTDDYTTAAENGQLVNSGVVGSFGDLFAAAQEAADGVESGATTMEEAMAAADESITNSISGNSIVPELNLLEETAADVSEGVVESLEQINNVRFSEIESHIDSLTAKAIALGNTVAAAAAAIAKAANGAPASGGNTTNNTRNTTVNVSTQSNAQALGFANVVTNNELRGIP